MEAEGGGHFLMVDDWSRARELQPDIPIGRVPQLLVHPAIRQVRSAGLLLAVEFDSFERNKAIIDACIAAGLLTDWFLFSPESMRIAPPLTISEEEIKKACAIILSSI